MAYMNQEKKSAIKALLNQAIPKTWKWSLAVRHYSTIVLTIAAAPVDLVTEYVSHSTFDDKAREVFLTERAVDVNPYYWREHFEGDLLATFTKIFDALNLDNHDHSDIQSDYFDVGHYVDVNIGRWNKPFQVTH